MSPNETIRLNRLNVTIMATPKRIFIKWMYICTDEVLKNFVNLTRRSIRKSFNYLKTFVYLWEEPVNKELISDIGIVETKSI